VKRFESKDGTVVVMIDDDGDVRITDGSGARAPKVLLACGFIGVEDALNDLDETISLLKKAKRYLVARAS
jgi:hypothetical protein